MGHALYRARTAVTELGSFAAWSGASRLDPAQVPVTVRNLVVHMDRAPSDATSQRAHEPAMRHVSSMLARLYELDTAAPATFRPVERRLVGHCRTSSVMATGFYREHGVAARPRCGFAVYYVDGRDFFGDHWVVEIRHQPTEQWRLVDTELDDGALAEHDITFDPTDVPRDQFVIAGQAWLECRRGRSRPETFGPYPGLTGWASLANQLLRDAACLVGEEVGPFDSWLPEDFGPEHERALDDVAVRCVEPEHGVDALRRLRGRHAWMVPPEWALRP